MYILPCYFAHHDAIFCYPAYRMVGISNLRMAYIDVSGFAFYFISLGARKSLISLYYFHLKRQITLIKRQITLNLRM
jgi:hypothetical protein